MQDLLDQAIEHLRRKHFLQKANEAYRQLKSDSSAWQLELAEREDWNI
jgi:hypothetical protein